MAAGQPVIHAAKDNGAVFRRTVVAACGLQLTLMLSLPRPVLEEAVGFPSEEPPQKQLVSLPRPVGAEPAGELVSGRDGSSWLCGFEGKGGGLELCWL